MSAKASETPLPLADAVNVLKTFNTTKFDQTVEIVMRLGIDPKQAAGIAKGSGVPNKEKVGKVTVAQIDEICKTKMADLNARDLDHARRLVEGTARSMGIEVLRD